MQDFEIISQGAVGSLMIS